MFKKFHSFLAAFLTCSFIFPIPVHAQTEKPLWWYNLDCNKDEQHFSGIEYCKGKPPDEYIHVIVIQLESPGIQIEYIIPNGIDGKGTPGECKDVNRSTKGLGGPGCDDPKNQNWYPVMSLEQAVNKAVKEPNLAVVINGDYSACTDGPSPHCPLTKNGELYYREHGPEGLTVVQGIRLDGPNNGDGDNNIVRRPYLVVSQSTPLRAELHQSASDKDGLKPYNWVYTGIGGAPWLIQNHTVATKAITSCENAAGSCYDGASQTAVGLTLDKKWMFLVLAVDANKLEEVATFMDKKLDVWQAIKFDGGGSSQLYYEGAMAPKDIKKKKPYVEMGDNRHLTNFLAVYAQPGTGIFSEVPPETPEPPSDTDLNWRQKIQQAWNDFWKGISDGISNWWDNLKKQVADALDAWWQDIQRKIAEWFAQQLAEWLNKLCGTAGLVPVTIAVIIYSHKRHLLKR